MQKFAFALGHLLEATFKILTSLGWLPVVLSSLAIFFGIVYWLGLQGRYNRRAKEQGTLA
jgi:hypothetical protein